MTAYKPVLEEFLQLPEVNKPELIEVGHLESLEEFLLLEEQLTVQHTHSGTVVKMMKKAPSQDEQVKGDA